MGVCASHVCLMLPMSEKGDISPGVLGGCELKTASPLNHGVTSPALKGNSHRIGLPSRIRFCYIWRLSTCPGLALSLLAHHTFPCSIFLLKKWTQPSWSLPPTSFSERKSRVWRSIDSPADRREYWLQQLATEGILWLVVVFVVVSCEVASSMQMFTNAFTLHSGPAVLFYSEVLWRLMG